MSLSTPYIAVGNNELENLPFVNEGDKIVCPIPKCKKKHKLKARKKVLPDGTKEKSHTLYFYHCGKHSYLGAIQKRLVVGVKLSGGEI